MTLIGPIAKASAKTTNSTNQGAAALTTGSFTPSNNSILVAIGGLQKDAQSGIDRSSAMTITDSAGLTWTPQTLFGDTADYGCAIRIWTAPVTIGVSMTATLGCGSNLTISKELSIFEYTGYNKSSPVGATAAGALGLDGAQSLTLSGATATTSSVCGGVQSAMNSSGTDSVTPGTSYIEVHDLWTTDSGGLQTQARPIGSTSTSFSWIDVDAAGVSGGLFSTIGAAIEIKASAAPTPVSFTTNNSAAPGSSVFTKPSGLLDGDVLYLFVSAFTQGDGTTASPPSGFTSVVEEVINAGASGLWLLTAIYRKIVTNAAGEPANYTIGDPSGGYTNGWRGGVLYAIRGADTTTPEDDSDSSSGTSGTLSTGSIIDSTGSDVLLLMNGVTFGVSMTTPTGMTQDAALDDGVDVKHWSQEVTSQLVSATRDSTLGSSNKWATAFVVIKPPSVQTDITGTSATVLVDAGIGGPIGTAVTGTSATVIVNARVGQIDVISDPVKVSDRGIRTSTSTGAAVVTLTNPTLIAVGHYLVARVSVDNSGSSGALPGLTVSDSKGHTWTVEVGALQDPGTASSGIACYLAYVKVVTPFVAGNTVTFTWTTGTPISAIVIEEWANIHTTTPRAVTTTRANNVSSTTQPTLAITPTAAGQLVYVVAAIEGISTTWGAQDADTTNGSWSDLTKDQGNTGTAATSVSVYGGYKKVTASGAQTWNNTLGVTSDWAAVAIVFARAILTASIMGISAEVNTNAGIGDISLPLSITGTSGTVIVIAGTGVVTGNTAITGTSATVLVEADTGPIGPVAGFFEDFTGTENANLANGWADDSAFGASDPAIKYKSNRGSTNNNVASHVGWKLHGLSIVSHDWQMDFDCNAPLAIGNGGVRVALVSNTTFAGLGIFIGNAVHIQKYASGGGSTNITNVDRPGDTGSLQNHVTLTHRGSDGFMEAFLDGVSFASWTDNSVQAGNMVYLLLTDTSSPTTESWIDNLAISDVISGAPTAVAITGTSATVLVVAGSGVITGNAAVTGTSATVTVIGGAGAITIPPIDITGTSAIVTVVAGTGLISVYITGTSSIITVVAGSGIVVGNAAVIGTSNVVAVIAGTGVIIANTAITGTSAVVTVIAGIGVTSSGAAIIGTSGTVFVNSGTGIITGHTAITGSGANINVIAGTGTIGVQTNITGTIANVFVFAGTGVIDVQINISGTSGTVAVTAGTGTITGYGSVTGTSATISVIAGTGSVSVQITGTGTIVDVIAGSGTITANTAITGTSAIVVVTAETGTITTGADVVGISGTVFVHSDTGIITGHTAIAGSSANVIIIAGTGVIGVQTNIVGISGIVSVIAGTGTFSTSTDVTGSSAIIYVFADTVTISGHAAIIGASANITVTAGIGTIGVQTSLNGISAIVNVIAGIGFIGTQGIPPVNQGAILVI